MEQNLARSSIKKSQKLKSIRISLDAEKRAEKLLLLANKKKVGRKIRILDLIEVALTLVEEKHIEVLQNRSMTNEDRKELLRQKYVELRGFISKDEFTGFMMKSEFLEFVKEADIQTEVR